MDKSTGTSIRRSLVWIAVLAALGSALVTAAATAQTDGEPTEDREERIAEAFETIGTDPAPTTIVDGDELAILQINIRAQGRGLADLPLVDAVHIGYRCGDGPTTLLYAWIDDFGLVDYTLGVPGQDAFVHLRTSRTVEPGICGLWVARGSDPGAFVSGGGLFDVVAGETTVVHFTGRAGSGFSCRGIPATIVGTSGDDVLMGTSRADVIVADLGNDVVRGRGGDDVICGGPGDDLLWGNTGTDRLFGGGGDDIVRGGGGSDLVLGGAGFDITDGGLGSDTCNGDRERRCVEVGQ